MTKRSAYVLAFRRWWETGTEEDYRAMIEAWRAWERAPWEWMAR